MAKGNYSPEPFDEETNHRQLVWEEFLVRSVEAANKAIEWLELAEYEYEHLVLRTIVRKHHESSKWRSNSI